jgi:hypothetical protein
VFVPAHAFVAWEVADGADVWEYLETTMVAKFDFDAACHAGRQQYEDYKQRAPALVGFHSLRELRLKGIWPME